MSRVRPIVAEDLQDVGDFLNSIFRTSRGVFDQQMLTDYPLVFEPTNFANSRIIVDDETIVSHAAIWPREMIIDGEQFRVAVLVAVATHPDYRKQGLAAEIVEDLQRSMHEERYDLGLLWTGVPDFYTKLGWQKVTPRGLQVLIDRERFNNSEADEFEIVRLNGDGELDELLEIHERETVRFQRDRGVLRTLTNLPKLDVWLAIQDSKVISYLVHSNSCNKHGLLEYGGEVGGISSLVEHVVNRSAEKEIPLHVYHPHSDLGDWVSEQGFETSPIVSSKGGGNEMIYLVNRERVSLSIIDQIFVWGLDHA